MLNVRYELVNMTHSVLCDESGVTPGSLVGKAVAVMKGNCTFSQKAQVAQKLGAAVLLIAVKDAMVTNDTEIEKVNIPLALMRYHHSIFRKNLKFCNYLYTDYKAEVQLYAPPIPAFDVSILVMLALAVFTVGMGGFWSGAAEREKLNAGPVLSGGEERADSGDLSLYSPLKVLLFVVLMCGMLVLMYFFYKWLVIIYYVSCGERSCSLRSLLLAAVCITLAVVWGVYRNEDRWIWILQDLLGVAFCLNFMKTITLSNYKICVILLCLLLVYDVFFVFITPFFTPNGESIMVQVALGPGAGGEKVNVCVCVFICALECYYIFLEIFNVCFMCNYLDLCACAAYCVGLVVTFVVMLLSKMGQPALLYLVPFTLITSAVVACSRKEFRQFWAGTTYQVTRSPLCS
uniref:PA domain-containing protein n=1 Tax=Astyanax mexicanus TaxID=7994 RepID=A0A8B9HLY3_ASTMX